MFCLRDTWIRTLEHSYNPESRGCSRGHDGLPRARARQNKFKQRAFYQTRFLYYEKLVSGNKQYYQYGR